MRRTTAMEISQFTQARIQLSDVVCIYIYHGCRAIKSASGRAENYPPACGRTNAGTDPTTYAPGKFWHANNYVGLHRYTIHGTVQGMPLHMHQNKHFRSTLAEWPATRGASSSKRQVRCSHAAILYEGGNIEYTEWSIFFLIFFQTNIDFIRI